MSGKQAKVLKPAQITAVLKHISTYHRYPERGQAMVLLSAKAGLRAGEIANLTWPMLTDARGKLAAIIELPDYAAKCRGGRTIPIHPKLSQAIAALWDRDCTDGPVIVSERGEAMTASSVSNWFTELYRAVGLTGCSSHSGRRTFITAAAQKVCRVGGSLRDVQLLAGHRSISMTQKYIEGNTDAQRRLINLL